MEGKGQAGGVVIIKSAFLAFFCIPVALLKLVKEVFTLPSTDLAEGLIRDQLKKCAETLEAELKSDLLH